MTTRTRRPATTETYRLILVMKDGLQFPIGLNGTPESHLFDNWAEVRAAIVDAVASVGLENVHTVAQVRTQTYRGKLVDFSAGHYTAGEIVDLCEQAIAARKSVWTSADHDAAKRDGTRCPGSCAFCPRPSVVLKDGRRVNVSIPE